MLPIPVTLQPSSAHRPGRPVRRLSVTPSSWAEQSVCASRIQQSWHRSAHTARPAPRYSGVVFHGMDHGPSFEAAQSLSLRGCPLLHADRTGLVHRTQLYAPSAAPRVGRPAHLPCRGGPPPRSVSVVAVPTPPFSILSVWFFLKGEPRRKHSCSGENRGPGALERAILPRPLSM